MDYVEMGRRIREERKNRNMAQAELAKSISLSTSYYGHLERGSRIPSIATMVLIAQELSMPLQYLVLGYTTNYPSCSNDTLIKLMNVLSKYADEWLPKNHPYKVNACGTHNSLCYNPA